MRSSAAPRSAALAGLSALACAAALGMAFGSERWLGLNPCAFCLLERRPYEVAGVLSLVALALPAGARRVALWAVLVTLLAAVVLSGVHVGVEQHWWPDPLPACSAPDFSGLSTAQRLAVMPARPAKPCEDPDYLIAALPVSFAQMAFAYALVFSVLLAMSLSAGRRRFR